MLLFLQNSAAGNRNAAALRRQLRERATARGLNANFVSRRPGESARRLSRRAGVAIAASADRAEALTVVAVGGDGTVNLAATLALEHGCPLGIIPAGTYNFSARNHGIPEDPEAALDLLCQGQPQPVQTGLVSGRLFMVNASVGLYAKLQQEREGFKRVFGRHRLVAVIAGIATLLRPYRVLPLRMSSDGQIIEANAATFIVSNNRLQLELIGIRDVVAIGAGQLYGALLRPLGRLAMLQMMIRGSRGAVLETPELDTLLLQSLSVSLAGSRRRSAVVAIDGERRRLPLPLDFRINPATLMLVRPPADSDLSAEARS